MLDDLITAFLDVSLEFALLDDVEEVAALALRDDDVARAALLVDHRAEADRLLLVAERLKERVVRVLPLDNLERLSSFSYCVTIAPLSSCVEEARNVFFMLERRVVVVGGFASSMMNCSAEKAARRTRLPCCGAVPRRAEADRWRRRRSQCVARASPAPRRRPLSTLRSPSALIARVRCAGQACERMAEQRMCSALSTYHMQTWLKLQAALQLCVGIAPKEEEERADALVVAAAGTGERRLASSNSRQRFLCDASATHSSL